MMPVVFLLSKRAWIMLQKGGMNADAFVRMLEEMVDLKVQQHAESMLKPSPEVAAVLHAKRETDRRRLEQLRVELIRLLRESPA